VRRRLALAGLAAVCAAPAAPQTPSPTPKPFTFEVGVDVVSLTLVVHDRAGRFVRGLTPKDVEVYEDGVRQEVVLFQEAAGAGEAKIPLSVVLVLDASGSMRQNLRFLQEAATTFVHKLEEVDTALIVDFNEGVRSSAEFTSDIQRLEQFVEALQAWGGTSLYDAVHYGLSRIRDRPGRKAVLVFSDGADTTSALKEREVIDYARSVEATVYCVLIRGATGFAARGPRGFLRKLASETGGQHFFPDKIGELVRTFAQISEELHNHYALAYTPKRPPDGTWRTVAVRVARKDADVRVRKGYFALARRRPDPPR
jgi:VWFA-related protein